MKLEFITQPRRLICVESIYLSVDFRRHDIYRSLAFEIVDIVFIESVADNRTAGLKHSRINHSSVDTVANQK